MLMSFLTINSKLYATRLGMEINFEGKVNKRLEKYMRDMIVFSMTRMIPKNILRNIIINVEVRQKVDNDNDGYCEVEDCNTSNKPREFNVVIRRDPSTRYMLMTLAHECVHIKQYALGELNENHTQWRGTRVNDEKINYWEHPWEIEAHGRERGLFVMYCEKYGYKFPRKLPQRDE